MKIDFSSSFLESKIRSYLLLGIHNCKKNSVKRILLGISQVPVWIPKQVSVYQPRRHWRSTLYVCTYLRIQFSDFKFSNFLMYRRKKSAPVWNYGANFCCLCILNACAQSWILTRLRSITFQLYFLPSWRHFKTLGNAKATQMVKSRKFQIQKRLSNFSK